MHNFCPSIKLSIARTGGSFASLLLAGAASLALSGPANATLTIDPTFDSSITSLPGAAAVEGAINSAIGAVEGAITSPHNITVSIDFQNMSSGLGESSTAVGELTYYQYYNAFTAVATQPNQLAALASLGTAPTSNSSPNPVNGSAFVQVTSAEARNLGFSASPSGFDSTIGLNTSITYPPQPNNGSTYGLQAVANHEIDEALGIGGDGSTIDSNLFGNNAVGDLDLYRYSAPGTRSYSDVQTTSPFSYFSINGGTTVLSYFNQTAGADYGDWLSNPIPTGFSPQVQDAFGEPGTNPALGTNEITAFNAIGYDVLSPVPAPLIGFRLPVFLAVGGLLFGAKLLERSRWGAGLFDLA
jgi:hypothetical protein